MEKIKIQVHTLLRTIGSVSLTLGVFFSVFGASDRTVSTTFLWIALLIGILSLIFAFLRGRSWYAGIVISVATYFFLITRTSPIRGLNFLAFFIALGVALYGIFLDPYTQDFKRRLFK